jgi:hypothetical protein
VNIKDYDHHTPASAARARQKTQVALTCAMRFWSWSGIAILALGLIASHASGAESEFRGAWVATVYNLDWPSKPALTPAAQ